LAGLSVACCALNLGLNVVLLPRWGIAGAASATTITYLVLMVTTYVASRSSLALRVQPIMLAASVVTTAVLLLSLSKLGQVSVQPFVNLLVRGGVGAGIVVVSMSVLSPEIRRFTWMRMLGKPSLRSAG
jgi:O-antigen/teichoic acid export membrane protein